MTYLLISPRGFSNETILRRATSPAIAERASAIINDDVNAWARVIPASHSAVRAAKRAEERYGREAAIELLTEADVAGHRAELIDGDGNRSVGGPRL